MSIINASRWTGLLLVLFIHTIFGQAHDPITADRPDQTESALLVPRGYLQTELCVTSEQQSGSQSGLSLPGILFRYGILENVELRLVTEFLRQDLGGLKQSGVTPAMIGMKVHLSEESGLIPQAALIGHISLPGLSSSVFKHPYSAPSFRFAFEHTISEDVSFGYNTGAEWDGTTPEPAFIYTAVSGISLSDRVGAYAEIYGFAPQRSAADHRADAGMTYLITSDLMIDVSGGIGLSARAPDHYVSVGMSFRTALTR